MYPIELCIVTFTHVRVNTLKERLLCFSPLFFSCCRALISRGLSSHHASKRRTLSCARTFTSCNTTSRDPERAFGLLAALLSSEREEQGGITADRRLSINYYCSRVREISLLHYFNRSIWHDFPEKRS